MHFGTVGRPPVPRLRTRDPGRFECRVQAPASALREIGCLSSWFGFRRLASDSDVPHRVVRIPHFGPGSGRRTRADPRAVLGNRPRGRDAAAPPLRSSSRAVLDQLRPRLLRSTRIGAHGHRAKQRDSKLRASELESFAGEFHLAERNCLYPSTRLWSVLRELRFCPWPPEPRLGPLGRVS